MSRPDAARRRGRTGPPPTAAQERALDLLLKSRRVLLTGHVRPDGDCIGAEAALNSMLGALGQEVHILNADPAPDRFDFLTCQCAFGSYAGGELPPHDLVVMLDGSELSRTGPLEPALRAADSARMIIDHHPHSGEEWWDEAYVDSTASATGLLVLRMARSLGVELDRVAALGVFTSIVTDTGWFKHSNTDAETLAAAAELIRSGVDPSELFGAVYQRNHPHHPLAIGRALSGVEYHADHRLAVASQPRVGRGEPELADSNEVLDILRSVGAVEVALLIRELEEGGCKISARSKGSFDVCALARRFGGGGHVKAAGATIPGGLDEVRARVVGAALEVLSGGGR